uniref:Uncharacterized protein n=1 Tax=Romanomermis culicivorax TaxID=13658 RepID=A0A915J833_ROMCU
MIARHHRRRLKLIVQRFRFTAGARKQFANAAHAKYQGNADRCHRRGDEDAFVHTKAIGVSILQAFVQS